MYIYMYVYIHVYTWFADAQQVVGGQGSRSHARQGVPQPRVDAGSAGNQSAHKGPGVARRADAAQAPTLQGHR